jgi:hypothetical protein
MKIWCTLFFVFIFLGANAQIKSATIQGYVFNQEGVVVKKASVSLLGSQRGTVTNDSGFFIIKVPAKKNLALLFSYNGYLEKQKNFYLASNETETITITLTPDDKTLATVLVTQEKERTQIGLIQIDAEKAITNPSTIGGIEGLIKTLVGSNNELTSNYSVRGGNYDENLIYVNDFEIFRPYLVRSGQQEGLSFINADMVRNVNFYTGGFQAKYGDKMSSVLDIQYKKPRSFAGSVYVSLLEQGAHIEATNKNKKATFLFGVRNRNNRSLLASQEVSGAYIPQSNDVQAFVTYQANKKLSFEFLGTTSKTGFSLIPESAKKTSSVFSPLFTANLGLDIFFGGREKDAYTTTLLGFTTNYQVNKKFTLKGMLSLFKNNEQENFDIQGAYLFGDRDIDAGSTTFGAITNPLGAGYYQNYARNKLNITVLNATLKGAIDKGKHYLQFGNTIEQTTITDVVREFELQDSAGYSLPYSPTQLVINKFYNSTVNLSIQKFSGFIQDNIRLGDSNRNITLQVGARYHYNTLNNQLLVSPRAQLSIKPNWKKNIIFNFALGSYSQPAFYRELRNYNYQLNTNVRAQNSIQAVAGFNYKFVGFNNSPLKLTAEAYYKQLTNVNVYDIDNVKIKYAANNNAKAYTIGLETRIYGQLVKDAESWFSFGIMQSKENLENDFYYDYKNAAGEIIRRSTPDKVVVDSVKNNVGYLRRPTDRLLTMGLYLEDYLATNKNFKLHLNLLYGSNMSYNIPNSVKYRNGLVIEPYIRVDVGFSAQLLSQQQLRRSYSPFKNFENIWCSFEVFNLIDRPNTISYQLIKDFSNNIYSIPNRLTPRLVNLKLVAKF